MQVLTWMLGLNTKMNNFFNGFLTQERIAKAVLIFWHQIMINKKSNI